MRLATLRTPDGTAAARLDGDTYTLIEGCDDVSELLADPDWREVAAAATGTTVPASAADLATLLPAPGKVICAGLNYATHIREMGRELPTYPTLFAKFADSLTGPYDEVVAPAEDPMLDWECELGVAIGADAYRVAEEDAAGCIAGYTVVNDVSMRGFQRRTGEWLQGKIWQSSTPVGPVLVTADEFDPGDAAITTRVNGRLMQQANTGDLVFTAAKLVAYVSTIVTLRAGDLLLTGTPGGVGLARDPQVFLRAGDVVEVEVAGLGRLENRFVAG
ncbi:fumarylacetoacetate hydrolase family protein [Raineyella sp. W15-4]|uniref:fumarylacetoacetate hydrolase family protein n=1 Tax=Raineyella sp. W15-4 TaxID=3081651 RepID=UPI0029556111|nr:fumarylacetoacetate hydrolase family protein [Raineyella sp. W15-4]WOQ16379.1 fumarylacetoacetate hydrolase family protein [Raineyella sp. W15-4]